MSKIQFEGMPRIVNGLILKYGFTVDVIGNKTWFVVAVSGVTGDYVQTQMCDEQSAKEFVEKLFVILGDLR